MGVDQRSEKGGRSPGLIGRDHLMIPWLGRDHLGRTLMAGKARASQLSIPYWISTHHLQRLTVQSAIFWFNYDQRGPHTREKAWWRFGQGGSGWNPVMIYPPVTTYIRNKYFHTFLAASWLENGTWRGLNGLKPPCHMYKGATGAFRV